MSPHRIILEEIAHVAIICTNHARDLYQNSRAANPYSHAIGLVGPHADRVNRQKLLKLTYAEVTSGNQWLLQQPGEPAGQRFLADCQFAVLKDADSAEWGVEIVVVEDQDMWQSRIAAFRLASVRG